MIALLAQPGEQVTAAQTWPERNSHWLSQRFEFWTAQLTRRNTDGQPHSAIPLPEEDEGFQPAALQLRALFGLSSFETELLVLASGVELDATLRSAVASAQGLSPQDAVSVSFALALTMLPEPHWDAISPSGPLRHWSLVEFDAGPGLAQSLIRVDERILHYLTGVAAIDERLKGVATLADTGSTAITHPLVPRMLGSLISGRTPLIVISDGLQDATRLRDGLDVASAILGHMRLSALRVRPHTVAGDANEIVAIARRLDREAALSSAGVVLTLDTEGRDNTGVIHLVASLRSPIVLLGSVTAMQLAETPRHHVLRFTLGPAAMPSPPAGRPAIERAARRALQQFRVEPEVIAQVLDSVGEFDDDGVEAAVWDGLREAARGGLDALAQRIDSRATFDDLVLPPAAIDQLRQIVQQLCYRDTVFNQWGFAERHSRGLGLAALFTGEPGTGKTLAAEVIANQARLDLYRIDLSSVVSKYIGETEKNLARVFDSAERSGAVLLFDEADALFGKRSDVKDSHDRYANIEVAYLLQRIESYRGLAILTTNLKNALDRAFLRRIQFVVQFPFPNAAARTEIWNRVFPRQAPTRRLDSAQLGRLNLSGGSIRTVAINAAFIAAARNSEIDMATVIAAARVEYAKLERPADAALEEQA